MFIRCTVFTNKHQTLFRSILVIYSSVNIPPITMSASLYQKLVKSTFFLAQKVSMEAVDILLYGFLNGNI